MRQEETSAAAEAKILEEVFDAAGQAVFDAMADLFPSRPCRMSARDYTKGLLASLERKNCVTIAEWAGHSSPDRLHYLLERACWEERELRVRIGALVAEFLDSERSATIRGDRHARPGGRETSAGPINIEHAHFAAAHEQHVHVLVVAVVIDRFRRRPPGGQIPLHRDERVAQSVLDDIDQVVDEMGDDMAGRNLGHLVDAVPRAVPHFDKREPGDVVKRGPQFGECDRAKRRGFIGMVFCVLAGGRPPSRGNGEEVLVLGAALGKRADAEPEVDGVVVVHHEVPAHERGETGDPGAEGAVGTVVRDDRRRLHRRRRREGDPRRSEVVAAQQMQVRIVAGCGETEQTAIRAVQHLLRQIPGQRHPARVLDMDRPGDERDQFLERRGMAAVGQPAGVWDGARDLRQVRDRGKLLGGSRPWLVAAIADRIGHES
ncbi:hypothetical protein FAB82_07810 [Glycomyces buryatensis]|uniref:Uncharacterized protein n=1 Tax=Glycomyces buryatensis TaxID=2570927 RepID=A0A4V4HSL5_9ACTN|nr:hypothetical protein FAB82_07810 [Glycomyces buryatensis]